MSTNIIDQIYDQTTSVEDLLIGKDRHVNEETVSELLRRSKEITSPLVATKVAVFIENAAVSQRILVTTYAVRDLLIDNLKTFATAAESVAAIGFAIHNLCYFNPSGKRLFSTPEIAAVIIGVLKH